MSEVDERYVSVPYELVNNVAHVGVDFGYGPCEIEDKWIELARRTCEGKVDRLFSEAEHRKAMVELCNEYWTAFTDIYEAHDSHSVSFDDFKNASLKIKQRIGEQE